MQRAHTIPDFVYFSFLLAPTRRSQFQHLGWIWSSEANPRTIACSGIKHFSLNTIPHLGKFQACSCCHPFLAETYSWISFASLRSITPSSTHSFTTFSASMEVLTWLCFTWKRLKQGWPGEWLGPGRGVSSKEEGDLGVGRWRTQGWEIPREGPLWTGYSNTFGLVHFPQSPEYATWNWGPPTPEGFPCSQVAPLVTSEASPNYQS